MILIVRKKNKIYYIKDFTGQGIAIKQCEENKFGLFLDDRIEPIAIYNSVENLNQVMWEISAAIIKQQNAVIFPPRDDDFKKEDIERG